MALWSRKRQLDLFGIFPVAYIDFEHSVSVGFDCRYLNLYHTSSGLAVYLVRDEKVIRESVGACSECDL